MTKSRFKIILTCWSMTKTDKGDKCKVLRLGLKIQVKIKQTSYRMGEIWLDSKTCGKVLSVSVCIVS